jgi:hypothetical protein
MNIRQAAVAGTFYEADAGRLQQHIASLMSLTSAPGINNMPQVLIVPHAGYIYSGRAAAEAYACVAGSADRIERVLLLGPAHRVPLQGMAVPSVDAFTTPLGDILLDRAGLQQARGLSGVCVSDEAHRQEHSLEVQLPFLQTLLGQFTLLPLVVGHCDAQAVASVLDALWGGPETLVVVSTDLSHFHNYDDCQRLDRVTCERLQAKDTALSGRDACGAFALNGLMRSSHCQALQVELLDLCNSGDTAGDKDRVVGYGAFVLH